MKSWNQAGPVFASLAFALIGCEPSPSGPVPKAEGPAGPASISTVEPPIEPSPIPSLPSTPRGDLDNTDEAKSGEKGAAESPPVESKPDPPK